jgi:autotransporter strand-loop-strand O-heptosyltransferase
MFREVKINATFGDRTGYQVHATNFFRELDKLMKAQVGGEGEVTISLLDTVTASHTDTKFNPPSILYNVWESTEQPIEFIKRLENYDQLWVASEWQRAASIAQGIPEEFVKVVPEGVDPERFKPDNEHLSYQEKDGLAFNFLHIGQWQPRKSTLEICQSFIKAFPLLYYPNVRLYLSADTLFPSDSYKSTQERLEAYGVNDSRIIPIDFEHGEDYVRRLQSSHVFVSCSRSEGWGLPFIEAMACGIPTIVADFGGSTEYASAASKVRVPELRKPHGIYGNWDVPGMWGEPDYDHLTEVMQNAYHNYSDHKAKALKTSEFIRTEFSWASAAKKAMVHLEELSNLKKEPVKAPESLIREFARSKGYEIQSMKRRSAIFTVDCHPDTKEKLDTLIETINQIKSYDYPILVSSHLPLPSEVVEMVDFYVYDKKDILSGDDLPFYWRSDGKGGSETTQAGIPCHALAALHNVRNACDLIMHKYDWMYQMNSDVEVDLNEWLDKVHASDKGFICQRFENQPETVSGLITAGKTELMDKILPRFQTWKEFADYYGEYKFNSEKGYYRLVCEHIGLENVEWLNMDIGNRFNQVDKNAWKDDIFVCHFVEGPFLHINGMSDREYDVTYSTPNNPNVYTLKQKCGVWSRPSTRYFQEWSVDVKLNGELKFAHTVDLKDKRVLISMSSKALGDTIAWMPYIEEFRKKHNCHVICSGWWLDIFDCPEIEFVSPGSSIPDIYASYEVGCFDDQLDKNVANWRSTPLQKVASDILGLEYKPLPAKLKHQKPHRGNGNPPKPYICFSEYSTMRNKFWNREGGWQKIIDYLNSLGYDCISISAEMTQLQGVISHNGQLISDTINDISGAEFYIGLNAGPSWIAYSLGIPCIMMTGVSEEWNDFPNPFRISLDICKPCFNNLQHPINRGFEWCPENKNYQCTRDITEEMVIEMIEKVRGSSCQLQSTKQEKENTASVPRRGSTQKEQPLKKPKPKRGSSTLSNTDGSQRAKRNEAMV